VNDSRPLDREGIFKAKPFAWNVRASKDTKSVGVNVGFIIDAQLDGDEWTSWADFEVHTVWGAWYPIGKTGQVVQAHIDQLAKALGWNGDLTSIKGDPPSVVVQLTVKDEPYNGQSRIKATWMEPEDFVPTGGGASEEDVKKLQNQFGSLLRAAAAGAVKGAAKPDAKKKPLPPKKNDGPEKDPNTGEVVPDDIPMAK
jgi:hypothetical protein